jgi:hypothetical protein
MRKNKILLGILLITTNYLPVFCQDKPTVNFSYVSQENIEYTALKSLFYLVRQEYVIISKNGEKITRGGNDYFGKDYAIGVLTKDLKLLFPKSIRYPWKDDENFSDYQRGYKAECTYTRFKGLEDPSFTSNDSLFKRRFLLNNLIDTSKIVLSYLFGQKGIIISDSISTKGSIILFHSSSQIPEKTEDLQYSILNIDDANWSSNGIYEFKVPYLGNQQIIGGAFFHRLIKPARIDWELTGILVPVNNKWVVKSIIPGELSEK